MCGNSTLMDIVLSKCDNKSYNLPACKPDGLSLSYDKDVNIQLINTPSPLPFAVSEKFSSKISAWRRLTANSDKCKAVYEVTFCIKDIPLPDFIPGDTIGIQPCNDSDDVSLLIARLGLSDLADKAYTLQADESKKAKVPAHVPERSTVRYVLTHCVELRSVVKKLFLLALSKHTTQQEEKRCLEFLCSKEGSTLYSEYILGKKLTILDILSTFSSCEPPITVLFANLPKLLPRPYSIVNCKKKSPNVIKICFSVIQLANGKAGLTTGMLENIILNQKTKIEDVELQMKSLAINESDKKSEKIQIYLRKNLGFSVPAFDKDVILIGPGTGIAPFIGFLEAREIELKNSPEKSMGKCWMFFGCRDPELDHIYKDELDYFSQKGVLTRLQCAYSRIENNKVKYVQDAIRLHGSEISDLIHQGAYIFVCGDLNAMAKQVEMTIATCLSERRGLALEDALSYLNEMRKEKRYVVDIWN